MSDALDGYRVALTRIASCTAPGSLLLTGALARDLCLPLRHRDGRRRTSDADVTVLMDSWDAVEKLFARLEAWFEIDRSSMRLIHRSDRAPVDLVPCGDIEAPPGSLTLPRSRRVLSLVGLRAAFSSARPEPLLEGQRILIPSPAAFVLLKLQSYCDREAPRDLRDAGYVLKNAPLDEDALWSDLDFLDRLSTNQVTIEDAMVWQLGRSLQELLSREQLRPVAAVIRQVQALPDGVRIEMMKSSSPSHIRLPEQSLAAADRMLEILLSVLEHAGAEP